MAKPSLRVLLVEDNESDALLILRLIRSEYVVTHERVETADQFLAALTRGPWDVIVADYNLPKFDAPAALALLQSRGKDIPFIVISGAIRDIDAAEIMKRGAHDYVPKERRDMLIPALMRELKEAHERNARRRIGEALVLAYEKRQESFEALVIVLALALAMRDKETEGHSQRVTEMTVRIARLAGVDEEQIPDIRRGALLHDVGKIAIPDAILQKAGPLTEKEWAIMRTHPVEACKMLSSVPDLLPALDIPCKHHEKWDGTGYPDGLAGDAIPLPARMFSVVDAWDALTSDRPYRAAMSEEAALTEIRAQAGKAFDPAIVEMFCANIGALRG